MAEPRQPLSEDTTNLCPLCGTVLIPYVGWPGEDTYEGIRCPLGCDLGEYYS